MGCVLCGKPTVGSVYRFVFGGGEQLFALCETHLEQAERHKNDLNNTVTKMVIKSDKLLKRAQKLRELLYQNMLPENDRKLKQWKRLMRQARIWERMAYFIHKDGRELLSAKSWHDPLYLAICAREAAMPLADE